MAKLRFEETVFDLDTLLEAGAEFTSLGYTALFNSPYQMNMFSGNNFALSVNPSPFPIVDIFGARDRGAQDLTADDLVISDETYSLFTNGDADSKDADGNSLMVGEAQPQAFLAAEPFDPANSMDWDEPLNTDPDFTSMHVFSTADITGTFEGVTQGDIGVGDTPVIDFSADPLVTKDGVDLFPINSEFGFIVTDFDGAIQKGFEENPEYEEGWAGDLTDALGNQIGLVLSDAATETFKTPAKLGTWLAGLGGNTVKASTEHYSVMQEILSNQNYPSDPSATYQLDDNLKLIGGEYDGMFISDILPIVGDTNDDGTVDIRDVLSPNESTIAENIAVGDDYSVTMKDDGKLLYRWGNTVKRPNEIRLEAELDLPDEWKADTSIADGPALNPLYRVTSAELVVHHTITNNPNDQVRPEDYENESAIGTLPEYTILPDGKWVSVDGYYAGDGTFYEAGTVLRDPALAALAEGSTLNQIGAASGDITGGFTNAWYTTMNREPFQPVLNDDGTEYVTGPRWRLQPDKYGQDLPSVVIPIDPSETASPSKDQVKYEVGFETQTVLNLLDWEFPTSPLEISAGWLHGAGTVTENGVTLSDNFDVAVYIKGESKSATLYSAQLVMDYEEITIFDAGDTLTGTAGDDFLVGQGDNTFIGGAGADLFVISYGAMDSASIQTSVIMDFDATEDMLSLIDLEVEVDTFDTAITQIVTGTTLHIYLNGFELARLINNTEALELDSFQILNTVAPEPSVSIVGDGGDNILYGGAGDDSIFGLDGNDLLFGLDGDDMLYGGEGNDTLRGGPGADLHDGGAGVDWAYYASSSAGVMVDLAANSASGGHAEGDTFASIERVYGSSFDDTLTGDSGANYLRGAAGDDILNGGDGADFLQGDVGADTLVGGAGSDWAYYASSTSGLTIDLSDSSNNTGEATGDTYDSVENILGSRFDDFITGDSGDNYLRGFLGDDIINGGAGDDILRGEAGADTFVFEVGTQSDTVIDFSDAEDMLDFTDFGFASVTEALTYAVETTDESVVFTIGDDIITIENITGAEITDNLII